MKARNRAADPSAPHGEGVVGERNDSALGCTYAHSPRAAQVEKLLQVVTNGR